MKRERSETNEIIKEFGKKYGPISYAFVFWYSFRSPICDLCRLFCSPHFSAFRMSALCSKLFFFLPFSPGPSVIILQNNNIVALLESFGWNERTKKFCLLGCLTSSWETFEKKKTILANFTPSQNLEIIGSLWLCFLFSILFRTHFVIKYGSMRFGQTTKMRLRQCDRLTSYIATNNKTNAARHTELSSACFCVCVRSSNSIL